PLPHADCIDGSASRGLDRRHATQFSRSAVEFSVAGIGVNRSSQSGLPGFAGCTLLRRDRVGVPHVVREAEIAHLDRVV
ncbi:hypothetical protein PQQ65_31205, partial [Paraburkholderia strydomiana]|uniref:hypothetical protein n=1 Tax=Paraburkholderia strydomiana TaxID=1245417 RepID=UPI0038B6EB67